MSFGPLTKHIAETCGYGTSEDGVMEMLKDASTDSVCPGVCRDCKAVFEEVEPDATHNVCESCGSHRVVSVLVLCGLI